MSQYFTNPKNILMKRSTDLRFARRTDPLSLST